MKKNHFLFLFILSLFVNQTKAQQEFFGNSNGLTLSRSTAIKDFGTLNTSGIDLYLKRSTVFSASITDYKENRVMSGSLNAFVTGRNVDSPTKGILGISVVSNLHESTVWGINLGMIHVFLHDSQFPFSIGAVANFSPPQSPSSTLEITPTVGYIQSFFARKQVYPVVGVTMVLPQNFSTGESTFYIHAGINIKLEKEK